MEVSLIFPHQLFRKHPALKPGRTIYFIEDELYFTQYPFHKNKLVLHRASMKIFAEELVKNGYKVVYVDAVDEQVKPEKLFKHFAAKKVEMVHYVDTVDYLLERRIRRCGTQYNIPVIKYRTPNFICDEEYINEYFDSGKKYFLAKFYEDQRRRLGILMDGKNPAGGKWSFDADNREKMPKETEAPKIPSFKHAAINEAKKYVEKYFAKNYGSTGFFNFPVTPEQAENALKHFLDERFDNFGAYQDAIVKKEHFLFHSVLSSSINTGLLHPGKVLEKAVGYAIRNKIPINSLEGFVRQILGWREYMRAIYIREGVKQRNRNFMNFSRKIPHSFYTDKTGIDPVDITIEKIMAMAYAHHIERLMVLGNFMLLCEFNPDEVYQWFMELFIDAYDWVMVPNVYGMSQFADGGLMSTKPYISSSNYILKMSDYKKGAWSEIWDALFWRFMHVHRDMLKNNPRLSMLLKTFDKMPVGKREKIMHTAEMFLNNIDKGVQAKLF